MWGRSAAVGAVVAAVLGVPVTSASAVRHLRQFNSPDRTIWCVGIGASAVGGFGSEGCFATLTRLRQRRSTAALSPARASCRHAPLLRRST